MAESILHVGLCGIGLDAYWPQFEGLHSRLEGYVRQVGERLKEAGAVVENLGLVDTPYSSVALVTDAFSADTRRSISYLTCTISRGSKNSPRWNFGSWTFPGSGFNVPSSSSARTWGCLLSLLTGTATSEDRLTDRSCNYAAFPKHAKGVPCCTS